MDIATSIDAGARIDRVSSKVSCIHPTAIEKSSSRQCRIRRIVNRDHCEKGWFSITVLSTHVGARSGGSLQ